MNRIPYAIQSEIRWIPSRMNAGVNVDNFLQFR
jgi:hypothetical protein